MSFLNALGSIGGGFSRSVDPALNAAIQNNIQTQGDAQAGSILQQLYGGGAVHPQSPLAGLLAKFGLGGQGQQPQAAPAAAPALAPQASLGATPQQPSPQSATPQAPTPQQVLAYAGQAAQKNGIDPALFQKFIAQESSGNAGAQGDGNSSFGPAQLHYGGVNPQAPHAGLGDEFTKATGLNARDPGTWQKQIDFAAQKAKQEGWTPWTSTMKKLGVDQWTGINRGQPAGPSGGPSPQSPQGAPPSLPIPQMSLQQIVQAAKRVNPNMSPKQLMEAVQKLAPIMNAQTQAQLRMVQQQLAAERERETENYHHAMTEDRARGMDIRESQFKDRQERLRTQADARLKEKYDALAQAKDLKSAAAARKEAEDAIKDDLAAERAEISAGGLGVDPAEAPRLKKEAAARADAAQKRLDALYKSRKGELSTPAKPTAKAVPAKPAAKAAAQRSNEITVGGVKWRYKGNGDWNDKANWTQVPTT